MITGRQFFFWIAGFFSIVFTASGFLVYFALSSWTGLETKHPYETGLAYNDQIESARTQDKRGFKVSMAIDAKPDRFIELSVMARDAEENPLSGKTVKVMFIRPVHEGDDVEVTLTEKKPGIYRGGHKLKLAGQWEARLRIRDKDEIIFRSRSRLNVK